MKYKVLIIDDDYENRQKSYEDLFARAKERANLHIECTFLENFADIQTENYNFLQYDGIILDVILDSTNTNTSKNYKRASVDKVFSAMGSQKVPVIMVSSEWDSTNAEDLFRAMEYQHCLGYLRWSYVDACRKDIVPVGDQIADQDLKYLINQLKWLVGASEHPKFVDIAEDNSLFILHLSDLHFNAENDSDLTAIGPAFRRQFALSPHFVCITGDFTERGYPSQFERAKNKLNEMQKAMEFPILMGVPGNHDVCVPLAAATRAEWGETGIERISEVDVPDSESLKEFCLRPYRDFAKNTLLPPHRNNSIEKMIFEAPDRLDYYWIEKRFLSLGLLFYGVNTSNKISSTTPPSQHDLATVHNLIGQYIENINIPSENLFTIGLYHHDPFEKAKGEARQAIFRCKPDLVLYGHSHGSTRETINTPRKVVRICSGTYTQPASNRAEDSLRGFTGIKLSRKNGVVSLEFESCFFEYSDVGSWRTTCSD